MAANAGRAMLARAGSMRAALNAIGLVLVMLAHARAAEPTPTSSSAGSEFFEKRIRPLLAEHCYQCHGKEKQESGLVLASYAALRKGGDRGTLYVAGDPDQSLLIQAVQYASDDLKMPPKGKLKNEQIADLVAWVNMGAPGPQQDEAPSVVVGAPANEFNLAERRRHWAYQQVVSHPPPAVNVPEWSNSPIDRFILSRLESAGLSPSAPAERRSLLRRAAFSLTGLPPTPAEVAAFLADERPDAYERQIDRLLASPRFGERFGRHWLDIVRYSETLGFEFDYDLHNAWRYRDYVIRAFNADLPYDQFIVEHLAGDVVQHPRRNPADGTNDSITATGFFWMHEGKQTPVDIRQEQADRIDNQIDVLGKALLGQTVACARCHDHKFDAITTRDYYALAGYLKSSRYQQAFLDPPERLTDKIEKIALLRAKIDAAARAELASGWLRDAKDAGQYLLAARQVMSTEKDKTNAAEVAKDKGLDAARLEQWSKALQHDSTKSADHPLFAWTQRAAEKVEPPAPAAGASVTFHDFSRQALDGWFVTGDAFRTGPAPAGQIVVGNQTERPVVRITTGAVDSGATALRLQGELRSPSFTLDKRYVHFRLAGDKARVNLVIDGYTLIMNPMYGKLTTAPNSSVLTWRTMPVDRWLGHRAFIEVSDSTIPMHGLNPPASTARVPDGTDGYIVLDRIVFSDDPNPPREMNGLSAAAVARAGDNVESLAAAYQSLIVEQIKRWQAGELAGAPDGADGIALLNWLLENGLLDGPVQSSEAADSLSALLARHRDLEASLPLPQRAPALADGSGEDEFVFLRGNYRALGERASRGPPEVLVKFEPLAESSGSGRLELAHRLADPANPLLGRVLVNRLWQHLFGEGLVRTPDDFGRMGQPPTHPELLDHLAAELVRGEWSVKRMIRHLVVTNTYRMSSAERGVRNAEQNFPNSALRAPHSALIDPRAVDPDNRLLHRMPIRRLEAEAIRDSILAVSGRLNLEVHGPSVLPHVTPHMEGRGKPNSGPLDGDGRRSIYINARRNFLTPLLLAFDYPVTFTSIGRRGASALPSQALTMMNDPFVVQGAERWAERMRVEAGSGIEERIAWLYQTAFARRPTADELAAAIDFLQGQSLRRGASSEDAQVWADLCHVLINVKEFIFID